jgi:RimJ/RimL family protein N-acetyltransferase
MKNNNIRSKKIIGKKFIFLFVIITLVFSVVSYISINKYLATFSVKQVHEIVAGKVVTLVKMTEDHFKDYHDMFSDTVRKNLEFPAHISFAYTIAYLKYEMKDARDGKVLLYAIFDNKDNKLIGSIEVRDKSDKHPGQLGCWINENYWGKGRLQEALSLVTKTFFDLKPKEKEYIAHVRLWNKRCYNALKKGGMKEIGYFYEDGQKARYILEMRRK